jgi:hypothetical protein
MHTTRIVGHFLGKRVIHSKSGFVRGKEVEEGIGDSLGMESVSPPMVGPYSTEDTMGMGLVVCILIRTLDPGKTEELIQFSTA